MQIIHLKHDKKKKKGQSLISIFKHSKTNGEPEY